MHTATPPRIYRQLIIGAVATNFADTCRRPAAVLSANQLIYNIQSSSAAAAAAAAVECKDLITTNDQES